MHPVIFLSGIVVLEGSKLWRLISRAKKIVAAPASEEMLRLASLLD